MVESFHKFNVEWKLPDIPRLPDAVKHVGIEAVGSWCRQFITANAPSEHLLTKHPEVVVEAYRAAINSYPIPKWGDRPPKLRYKEAVQEFTQLGLLGTLLPQTKDQPAAATDSVSTASTASTALPRLSGAKQTAQASTKWLAYFPGITTDACFCTNCARGGHVADNCPDKQCRFCGSRDGSHTSFGCPTKRCCRHCPGTDHDTAACPQNSNSSGGCNDGDNNGSRKVETNCAYCGSCEHNLAACPRVWRTYTPDVATSHKVQWMAVSCYYCGEAGHWGGDCALNKGEHISGRRYALHDDIWNSSYANTFIDANDPTAQPPLRPIVEHSTSNQGSWLANTKQTALPSRPMKIAVREHPSSSIAAPSSRQPTNRRGSRGKGGKGRTDSDPPPVSGSVSKAGQVPALPTKPKVGTGDTSAAKRQTGRAGTLQKEKGTTVKNSKVAAKPAEKDPAKGQQHHADTSQPVVTRKTGNQLLVSVATATLASTQAPTTTQGQGQGQGQGQAQKQGQKQRGEQRNKSTVATATTGDTAATAPRRKKWSSKPKKSRVKPAQAEG